MATNNSNQGKNLNKKDLNSGGFSNENDQNLKGNKNVQGNAANVGNTGNNMGNTGNQNPGTNMGNTKGTAWGSATGSQGNAGISNVGNVGGSHAQGSTLTGQVDNPTPGNISNKNIGAGKKDISNQAGNTNNDANLADEDIDA